MDMQQEAFLCLSVYLTGFERVDLMGTGMLEEYYKFVVCNVDDEACQDLWSITTNTTKKLDGLAVPEKEVALHEAIKRSLMNHVNLGPIAKNIIRLWYLGTWQKDKNDPLSAFVTSAVAYQEGLIWKVMHTHPPGAKQPGFGSWSDLPLSRAPALDE